jgi:hypothetical protein
MPSIINTDFGFKLSNCPKHIKQKSAGRILGTLPTHKRHFLYLHRPAQPFKRMIVFLFFNELVTLYPVLAK